MISADKFWNRKANKNIGVISSSSSEGTESRSDDTEEIEEDQIDLLYRHQRSFLQESSKMFDLLEEIESTNNLDCENCSENDNDSNSENNSESNSEDNCENNCEDKSNQSDYEENKVIQLENNKTGQLEELINQPRSFSGKTLSIGISDFETKYFFVKPTIIALNNIRYYEINHEANKKHLSPLLEYAVNFGFLTWRKYVNNEENDLKTVFKICNEENFIVKMDWDKIKEMFNFLDNYLNKISGEDSIISADTLVKNFNKVHKDLKIEVWKLKNLNSLSKIII